MDLVEGKIGNEVEYDLEVRDGKIIFSIKYDGKGANVGTFLELETEYFLNKFAKAIPGEIDDVIIAAFKGALK